MRIPGLVDLQVNGYVGVNFSAPDLAEEAAVHACRALLDAGTAAFLPTVVTSPPEVYERNLPLLARFTGPHEGTRPDAFSLVGADVPHVVVETVKRAEDGNGVIVRFYESQRQRGAVTLTTSFDLAEAWHTNLLEENQEKLEPSGNQVSLPVTPYQIVTLRLVPA